MRKRALAEPSGSYIAALSILVTAPLGARAIPTFAPKLLQKGEVDPTKVAIARLAAAISLVVLFC